MTTEKVQQYKIPEWRLPLLQSKLEAIGRKCEKLGFRAPVLKIVGEEFVIDDLTGWQAGKLLTVELDAETPKLNGWGFVAVIQHLQSGNLINRCPGYYEMDIPELYRKRGPVCDHCQMDRDRNDTYLVHNSGLGEFKQVGSTCLGDFTGSADPHRAARYAELMSEVISDLSNDDDDIWGGGGSGPTYIPIEKFLSFVSLAVRRKGWVSRAQAARPGDATADRALAWMFKPRHVYQSQGWRERAQEEGTEPLERDDQEAVKVLGWVRNDLGQRDRLNDYESNLVTACLEDVLIPRNAGIVASAVSAYKREMAQKQEAAANPSVHVGKVGERQEFKNLTVAGIWPSPGVYGVTYITRLVDQSGNQYTWFASSELEEGKVYSGKATVKEHGEYKGVKQTVLTRCKFELSDKVPVVKCCANCHYHWKLCGDWNKDRFQATGEKIGKDPATVKCRSFAPKSE